MCIRLFTHSLRTPSLEGVGKSKRRGYAATQYRIDEDDADEEEDTDDEEDDDDEEDEEDEVQIENQITYTSIEGLEDINSDLTFEYDEVILNELNVIGDQIFIDAMLDFGPELCAYVSYRLQTMSDN